MRKGGKSREFIYVWVVRCKGGSVNRNVECSLVPEAPVAGFKPLIEVVDCDLFPSFSNHLRKRYNEILVDFPLYLLEKQNKFSDSVQKLVARFPDPTDFFKQFKQYIDIPVVSATHTVLMDYDSERNFLDDLKANYEKIAVRIQVPTVNLRETRRLLRSYNLLLDEMRENDVLLLDVFSMSRVEAQISLNLELMTNLAKEKSLQTILLNAFDPYDTGHNYGPILSYHYDLAGFGDFATEKRFPASGGTSPTKIVRYYYWTKFVLKEFANNSYPDAALQLKNSRYWTNHISHHSTCGACENVQLGNYNNGHSYWKKFRILHYMNSIAIETRNQFANATSAENLDPDGYDTLFNVGAF